MPNSLEQKSVAGRNTTKGPQACHGKCSLGPLHVTVSIWNVLNNELTHDSLAGKIAEKRTAEEIQLIEVVKFLRNASGSYRQTDTLLDKKQLKYVKPFLHLLNLSKD